MLLLIYFFSNRSLGTFFHGFRIPYSVSVIPLTFPDSGCRVLVLPIKIRIFVKNWYRWETTLLLYMYLLFVQQCKLQYVKFHVVANSSSLSLNKSSLATAVVHTSNREIRSCVKWLLTSGLEEMGNYLNCQPKMGSQLRAGINYLRVVPTVRFWLGNLWCFG